MYLALTVVFAVLARHHGLASAVPAALSLLAAALHLTPTLAGDSGPDVAAEEARSTLNRNDVPLT